ncbi:50S ribosomal protein L17 [Patescibacteria group bacterium]|nr:50S ribosomal protein L17 [Patescibacteria group bacterium]
MMANLATSLIIHDHVVTTEAKGKEVRRYVEPLITKAAKSPAGAKGEASVPTIRALNAALPEKRAVTKLMKELGPKYKERPGGYVRLTKLGQRVGDAAHTVKVELV